MLDTCAVQRQKVAYCRCLVLLWSGRVQASLLAAGACRACHGKPSESAHVRALHARAPPARQVLLEVLQVGSRRTARWL